MKKYNNYKKYYESHKEQEKQRYLAYYYANREKILAERKEKRKNVSFTYCRFILRYYHRAVFQRQINRYAV